MTTPEIGLFHYGTGECSRTYWHINQCLHRLDGPASIWYYKNGNVWVEEYYIDGKKHRADGPAIIVYYVDGPIKSLAYYKNGNEINSAVFDGFITGTPEFKFQWEMA